MTANQKQKMFGGSRESKKQKNTHDSTHSEFVGYGGPRESDKQRSVRNPSHPNFAGHGGPNESKLQKAVKYGGVGESQLQKDRKNGGKLMSQLQKDKIYGGVGMTQKQLMKRSEHQMGGVKMSAKQKDWLATHWYQKKNGFDRGEVEGKCSGCGRLGKTKRNKHNHWSVHNGKDAKRRPVYCGIYHPI